MFRSPAKSQKKPRAIILANLGTPDAPDTPSLRKYLAQFLKDQRIVEIPRIAWWPILYGVILTTRPAKSAKLYKNIWTEDGSPLLTGTVNLASQLAKTSGEHVVAAMRYGSPSIDQVVKSLIDEGYEKLEIIPLYPQYSATSTASVYDAVFDVLKGERKVPAVNLVKDYFDHPGYITALAQTVRKAIDERGQPDCLLVSFHGIPQRCVDLGDPYDEQCKITTQLLVDELELEPQQWELSFQSRFGKAKWLTPATDQVLEEMPTQGMKNIMVICPGFAIDCLETLDEIDREAREIFMGSGGENFYYIPALNDSEEHALILQSLLTSPE